jgi:RNA recognition motif-containing protein
MGFDRGSSPRQGEREFPDDPASWIACDDRPSRFLEKDVVKKIYVGNLPFSATEAEVSALFSKHGTVHSVALINDRETGRPRGFGFIEMDDAAVEAAIRELDGYEMDGRNLRVNEAQDRRSGGGGGGGGGGGRGGGRGGGGGSGRGGDGGRGDRW